MPIMFPSKRSLGFASVVEQVPKVTLADETIRGRDTGEDARASIETNAGYFEYFGYFFLTLRWCVDGILISSRYFATVRRVT